MNSNYRVLHVPAYISFLCYSVSCSRAISFFWWRVVEQGILNNMPLLGTLYVASLLRESRSARGATSSLTFINLKPSHCCVAIPKLHWFMYDGIASTAVAKVVQS